MAAICGGDPLSCIEFVILGIGEFLKDWTTMAMLAVMLVLLLRLRSDRTRAKEAEYANILSGYADRRDAGGHADPARDGGQRLPRGLGFTTIELVTVTLIVGIMAYVALPRLDLLRGFDEEGYRDTVRASLQFARKAAVAQRRYVCAVINAAGDITFTVESLEPENAGHSATCPYARQLGLPATDTVCGGATNMICHPAGVSLTPAATLQFDPLGRATLGAGTYTISGGGNPTVTVVGETGHVY